MGTLQSLGKLGIVLAGLLVAAAVGVALFVVVPAETSAGVVGVLLAVATAAAGLKVAGSLAGSLFPGYNVAEVEVTGPITADGGGMPLRPGGASADDVVDQIEAADADDGAEALVVTLNTPGGQPVASDEIRHAAAKFDGPTVAHAKDICASGGYMIACGCDEFVAHRDSLVGSIGVIANQRKFADFADRYGIDLERFTGGKYKDTTDPLKALSEDERAYFQGVIDSSYESFVDLVAEERDIDRAFVDDTEARIYHGRQAAENGLVDALGDRDDVEERLAERAGLDDIAVEQFEPDRGIGEKLSVGAQAVARAFGRGAASVVADRDGSLVEFRLK
ncbi:signal peptide peptidase SppA [Halostella salina]|uniref:signal peptide peptidase SppA n=1 Tax=Halostella salina TaxID=1547897 RepID=UPI000EF7B26A|nr:signal peptide peptidase SppA [Halostella salina]